MSKQFNRCAECGKSPFKPHRIYKELAYCSTCYAREFKTSECRKCGRYARLAIFDKNATCKKCELDIPCIRCNKEDYSIGRITQYGPVCSPCAYYFNEPKACPICGTYSKRLASNSNLGHTLKVCEKCQRSSHKVCPSCNNHRQLHDRGDGIHTCRKCGIGEVTNCLSCNTIMPAGRTKFCVDCTWQNTFENRLKICVEILQTENMSHTFNSYGKWMAAKLGNMPASQKINKDSVFFCEIESIWKNIPSYEVLISHYSPEGLRAHRRLVAWLNQEGHININEKLKSEASEQLQIEKKLSQIPQGSKCYKPLHEYYQVLEEKQFRGKIKIRTIRLAISAVVNFLLAKNDSFNFIPNQDDIDIFLTNKPGQKGNLTGFVNHLNKSKHLNLTTKANSEKIRHLMRRNQAKNIEALINERLESDEAETHSFKKRWFCACMIHHYHLSHSKALKIYSTLNIPSLPKSYTFQHEGLEFCVPGYDKSSTNILS